MTNEDDKIRSTAAFIHLRTMGRAKGSLTYADVDDNLPRGVTSASEIDVWLSALSDEGIEIVDVRPESE